MVDHALVMLQTGSTEVNVYDLLSCFEHSTVLLCVPCWRRAHSSPLQNVISGSICSSGRSNLSSKCIETIAWLTEGVTMSESAQNIAIAHGNVMNHRRYVDILYMPYYIVADARPATPTLTLEAEFSSRHAVVPT